MKKLDFFSIINKIVFVIFVILTLLYISVRFIEPNIVTVDTTKIDIWLKWEKKLKIAVIADTHLWIYTKEQVLKRVIDKINSLDDIEMLFIAWDHTYFPEDAESFEELKELLLPIKNVNVPVYAVLGNHDVGYPWPPLRKDLIWVLEEYGVQMLNNDIVEFDNFDLVWLGSHWAWEDDVTLLNRYSKDNTVIVLTHNPDTINYYTKPLADLTIVWHTHWWQVKIPFLYEYVLPNKSKHDEWLYLEKYWQLFVTSWVWTIGLPFRFLNPPVVDVLEIY